MKRVVRILYGKVLLLGLSLTHHIVVMHSAAIRIVRYCVRITTGSCTTCTAGSGRRHKHSGRRSWFMFHRHRWTSHTAYAKCYRVTCGRNNRWRFGKKFFTDCCLGGCRGLRLGSSLFTRIRPNTVNHLFVLGQAGRGLERLFAVLDWTRESTFFLMA